MKPSVQERVLREEEAHATSSIPAESVRLKNRFHHIWSYPSRRRLDECKEKFLSNVEGLSILDYGCSWGANGIDYCERGARVVGIDISESYVDVANEKAQSKGFSPERCKFLKMDAHVLEFADEAFDFVVGDAILHHLDTEVALPEIHRVLKKGGRAIFFEPLAGHPLLKIFRVLTPKARTVDEMPFSSKHLKRFSEQNKWSVEHEYCGILEAPVAIVTSILMPEKPDNIFLRMTDKVERLMIKYRILLSWNQYVLMIFRK